MDRDYKKEVQVIEQKEVKFQGAELMGVKADDGKVYTAMRWILQGVGFNEGKIDREISKAQEDEVIKRGVEKLSFKFAGQVRSTICLDIEFLPLWLAKISITPTIKAEQPEVAWNMVQYQLKAKDVLAEAFLKQDKPQSIEDLIIMQAQSVKQLREEIAVTSERVHKIQNSFAQIDEDWRIYANDVFARIGDKTGDFSTYRKESYLQLERRARCNLEIRLENKRNRMKIAGVCKSNIKKVNYLDVIEDDSKLVEIYVAIVKEFEAKYL